ncbi:MAG: Smr/MutS family protein [Muribaculaceae bacterium]|nr:Smr/MutS family protein [Muribaculaceae bacterium]
MIYPSNFEEKIGFLQLRQYLKDRCISPLGVKKCDAMSFLSNYDKVNSRLLQTHEMLTILNGEVEIPIDNIHDMTQTLSLIRAEGSYMSADNLYKLKTSLDTIRKVHSFFSLKDENDVYVYPNLSELFRSMSVFPTVVASIESILNKFGEIKDTASPTLADIRRSLMSVSNSISSVMRRVVDRAVSDGIVDRDSSPSMRDGRLVIPVAAMMKRKINGIVHDESATGKTVYIEPAEVVEANNRLRELQNEEKREIIKILVAVASEIRPLIDDMLASYSLLGVYDFIRAKAILARDLGGEMPVLSKKTELEWYHAVHPILLHSFKLQNRQVVPLDIKLDKVNRLLIISGPNAGGKSVCLKTVGIVQYMMQCGMLPPVYSNSHMGLFDKIFIDIGDEQSIENDLSTYSSHLKNMKFFMNNCGKRTLILVDEMGSGTEPQIGGALAQAIISELNKSEVMGIVTTHYQNLKTFADSTDGLINGAMLYDRQNMQPLFQLSVGNAGSSFAIEIARKIGIPSNVIANAESIVGSDYINMDKFLLDIARDKRYWSNKRLSIKEKEHKLDELLSKYDTKLTELKSQRTEILSQAKREASEILSTTNAQVERTIHEIRKSQAEKEKTKQVRKELEDYKKQVQEQAEVIPELFKEQTKKKNKAKVSASPQPKKDALSSGDYVRMSDGGVVGKILSIQGKKAEVVFGSLRTFVDMAKLVKATKPKETISTQVSSVSKSTSDSSRKRQLAFSTEIDLRGMRVDEALQAMVYFLDDAVQFNASRLRILHGTGTGALKVAIRQLLKTNPNVSSFADEDVRFGGAGITVVNLN